MGATTFHTYQAGTNAQNAYAAACADALDEYGHNGYNGTISTTAGFTLAMSEPMTMKGAEHYASANMHRTSKWEACLAVPVADAAGFTYTETKGVVELPPRLAQEWGGEHQTNVYDLQEAAVKQALANHGSRLHDVFLTPRIKTKVVTDTPKGKPQMRYRVEGVRHGVLRQTKREAVLDAKALVESNRWGDRGVAIESVRYWPESNTTEALRVRLEVLRAAADVKVTIARPTKLAVVTGYLFFGWAAE